MLWLWKKSFRNGWRSSRQVWEQKWALTKKWRQSWNLGHRYWGHLLVKLRVKDRWFQVHEVYFQRIRLNGFSSGSLVFFDGECIASSTNGRLHARYRDWHYLFCLCSLVCINNEHIQRVRLYAYVGWVLWQEFPLVGYTWNFFLKDRIEALSVGLPHRI